MKNELRFEVKDWNLITCIFPYKYFNKMQKYHNNMSKCLFAYIDLFISYCLLVLELKKSVK